MAHLVQAQAHQLRQGHGDDTWLLSLDPRVRILVASAFAILVVALSSLVALLLALGLAATTMLLARLPPGPTLRRVAAMDGFIIVMLVMLPFTTPGAALFTIGPLTASAEGFRLAITIALKANAIIMMLLSLVGTIEPAALGHALFRLRAPPAFVHLLLFTVRYIEVLNREYQRLRLAMKARAFEPRNALHTYKSVGYLVGMLLVRSLDRSERILAAMKCRGFDGRFHVIESFRLGQQDAVFASIALLSAIGLLVVNGRYGVAS